MAQLTLDKLHAVVGLGIAGSSDTDNSLAFTTVGTGFLYAHPEQGSDGTNQYGGWLVTCKHVVEDIRGLHESVMVRTNKEDSGGMEIFRTHLEWTFHRSADVAVCRVDPTVLEKHNVQYMALAHGYTREGAMAASLLEGDGVFIIGFPHGWKEGRHDYPVVRHGVLAQIRGWYNQEHQTFLVDGSGFGGNSGGPVVTKPEMSAVSGFANAYITESKLIGMVSQVTRELASGQHSDLVVVVPVDSIEETIELAKAEGTDLEAVADPEYGV